VVTPNQGDDEAWAILASLHDDGCEWVATRAHTTEVTEEISTNGSELLDVARLVIASWDCTDYEDAKFEDLYEEAVCLARKAIAKIDGKGTLGS
jgi:hypothetical protein